MSAAPKSQIVDLRIPVHWTADEGKIRRALAATLGWSESDLGPYRVIRKNLDARKRSIAAVWKVECVSKGETLMPFPDAITRFEPVASNAATVHVVGAGPAGLFAALELIRLGVRPVVIERGQPVRQRRRDLVEITRHHRVDPDSNYCFGEGGAGTYSDGKLYTRSHKRGDIQSTLQWLVQFGADPEILVEAHPHSGTNKLPGIIERMREQILAAGGAVHFGCRLVDAEVKHGKLTGLIWQETASGKVHHAASSHVILATGHSARDVFEWMHKKGWALEPKPFAVGVRIEHPQALVDAIQYHGQERGDWLPPASYRLVCQANGRGVHSFCMCPGGIIAPCATEPDHVVTNGWSPSKRNNPFANSGIVVQLSESDWLEEGFEGPLGGLEFQRSIEQQCWRAAGENQAAPAQRLVDFLHGSKGRVSESLPACSYVPGIVSVNLRQLLPRVIAESLATGLSVFVKRMPQFLHADAVLVAPESRTSSPVRIPRLPGTLSHPDVNGLYPCGEGAGYAGGILSAAMDGVRIASQVHRSMQ